MGNDGRRCASSNVLLEIETVEVGHEHVYEISRSWRDTRDICEVLHITRNGEKFRELNVDQYQSFLDELVPLGLAELFFFDGERIQTLAEEDGNDYVFAESMRGLLGLNITSRLMSDMAIYIRSREQAKPLREVLSEVNAAEADLGNIIDSICRLDSEITTLEDAREKLERSVMLQEKKIASEGGDFALRREMLLEEQSKWQTTIQSIELELRELANDLLPFALVPELCEAVRQGLEEEAISRQSDYASSFLLSKREELLALTPRSNFWATLVEDDLSRRERELINRAVTNALDLIANEQDDQRAPYVHDLSERHQRIVNTAIDQVLGDLPVKAIRLAGALQESKEHLFRILQDLNRAPKEAVLEPLLSELGQLQTELSKVVQEQALLEEEKRRTLNTQEECARRLAKLTDHVGNMDDERLRISLAVKVQNVLRTYEQELIVARVDHLADVITECYRELAHKESSFSHVGVDPVSLAITLYDSGGNVVYRPLLSAGEKQLFAIALLWGLSRASGREIPVIVDTPLARLDAVHRCRLVTRYFPNASHQVIVLSTDSEVANEELEILAPSIAKKFHLKFDGRRGRSSIEPGYLPV